MTNTKKVRLSPIQYSGECNGSEKHKATNESKESHCKNGTTPQNSYSARKEKYIGGNCEGGINLVKNTNLRKSDKTSKVNSSRLDNRPTTRDVMQEKQEKLARHLKDIRKSVRLHYDSQLNGNGEPREKAKAVEFGDKLIDALSDVTMVTKEMKRQNIIPTSKLIAHIEGLFDDFNVVSDVLPDDRIFLLIRPELEVILRNLE